MKIDGIIVENCTKNVRQRRKRICILSAVLVFLLVLSGILFFKPFYRNDAFGVIGVNPLLVDKIVVTNASNCVTVTDKAEINKVTSQIARYPLESGRCLTDLMGLQYRIDLYSFGKKSGSVYFTDKTTVLAGSKTYDGKTDTTFLDKLFQSKSVA